MKRLLFALLLLGWTGMMTGQNLQQKIWDELLKNNREKALKLSSALKKKKDAESLILHQIVRTQASYWDPDRDFMRSIVRQPGYEHYLYTFQREPFFFYRLLGEGNLLKSEIEKVNFYYKAPSHQPLVKAFVTDLKGYADYFTHKREEAVKEWNDIGVINDWQICGVFENMNESGMQIRYEPETKAFSKEPFNANSNGKVNWFVPSKTNPYGEIDLSNYSEYGSGIVYAQTFLTNAAPKDVFIRITADDAVKIWLDDVLLFEQIKKDAYDFSEFRAVGLHLPAGQHRLLIKMNNNSDATYRVRFTDANGKPVQGITFSSKYTPYHKATRDELKPRITDHPSLYYFQEKFKQNPDNFLYRLALTELYIYNGRLDDAKKLVEPYLKKYPKSSLLRSLMVNIYTKEENNDKVNEIKENMKNDDPDYYVSALLTLNENKKLMQKDMDAFKETIQRIKKNIHLPEVHFLADLYMSVRTNDKNAMVNLIKNLLDESLRDNNLQYLISFGALYAKGFNKYNEVLSYYNKALKNIETPSIYNAIIQLYTAQNMLPQAVNYAKKSYEAFPYLISQPKEVADLYIQMNKEKKALPYIDAGLELFPYSFVLMEEKGNVLQHLGKKDEALQWFEKALSHYSGWGKLRKKILDLRGETDPVKTLVEKDIYDFIKKHRGKIKENNYGYNYLMDAGYYQVYKEGGYKMRQVLIYEVTSEKGVERLKEMNRGNWSSVFIKSEIVKPDGRIVPASRSGSHMVFSGLEPGDVILIDYETTRNKTGRFYKEFDNTFYVKEFAPKALVKIDILFPKNMKPETKILNGDIPFTKKSFNKEYNLYEWKAENLDQLPSDEKFMPELIDVGTVQMSSTYGSWDRIADWYADLSRASIEYNDAVNKTFDSIFPQGYQNLSETERARRIYNWMQNNLTYSFVDFRQSGYIPQKPALVITSKMGDCKDLSTLFLTLGRKAGLKINLVLVSTNDNGENYCALPAIKFNHAIATAVLDGKKYYIELTDKYLPFLSKPTSLFNAGALEIPYEGDKVRSGLIHIPSDSQVKCVNRTDAVYTINDDGTREIEVTVTGTGRINSNYNEMLDEDNEEQLKKNIQKFFENMDDLDLELLSYDVISKDKTKDVTKFKAKFRIKNKIQKLGKARITTLPLQLKPYTSGLIKLDERHYPIKYYRYEDVDRYEMHYTIRLKGGRDFKAIPENASGTFKGHSFSIRYHKVKPGLLKVDIIANTPIKDITPEEYKQFKQYVQKYLEA
ncbi:MAG: hypothetical protein GXO24_04885, partial [Chlorobi bacterium]|nr:hypothetical protein [Chlorobiota bacterium]